MAQVRDVEKDAVDHGSDTARAISHDDSHDGDRRQPMDRAETQASTKEHAVGHAAAESGDKESGNGDVAHGFTPAQQRSIVHRVDRRLITTVGAMYCVSLMDRTNLSAAAIAGMTTELTLGVENRYVSLAPSSSFGDGACSRLCVAGCQILPGSPD